MVHKVLSRLIWHGGLSEAVIWLVGLWREKTGHPTKLRLRRESEGHHFVVANAGCW